MNATQQLRRRLVDELAESAAHGSRNHDPHALFRCAGVDPDLRLISPMSAGHTKRSVGFSGPKAYTPIQ